MFDLSVSPRDEGFGGAPGGADAGDGTASDRSGSGGGRGSGQLSLGEVVRGLAGLASLDVSVVGDAELVAAARLVEQAQRGLDGVRLHVVGELDVRGTTDVELGLRTPGWLAREARLPGPVAKRSVRLRSKLRRFPNVDAALTAGLIGVEQVRVLLDAANDRIAHAFDAAVPELVKGVGSVGFAGWRAEVLAFAALLDQDGPDPEQRPSSLSARKVGDDVVLKGHIAGLDGEGLRQAVEGEADRLYRQAVRDCELTDGALPVPSRSELSARALVELVRKGLAAGHRGTGPAPEVSFAIEADPTRVVDLTGDPTPGARRWLLPDGTVLPADAARCATDDSVLPNGLDHTDLPGNGHGHGDRCCGPQGRTCDDPNHDHVAGRTTPIQIRLPDGSTMRLRPDDVALCDPLLSPVILDSLGVPVDLGRTARYANRDQRRALAIRDGGCVFPGCDAPPRWCDAHHVIWWEHHGPTDLDNLALLCRYHHGVTHRTGWTMTTTPDQWFTWTTPAGHTIESQRHGHTRAGPAPPTP